MTSMILKIRLLPIWGTKVDAWKSNSDSTTAATTTGGRRKRQASSVVEGLIQLAGFTLSIFNRQEVDVDTRNI